MNMQLYEPATLCTCNSMNMQLYEHATLWTCNSKDMQLYGHGTRHLSEKPLQITS